jgi:hypothetical protein
VRKDHKTVPPGQEESGPPVRPICSADNSPNSRFGHFLSKMINNYADSAENKTECRSSEEMRAAFEAFNNLDKETRTRCRIVSMDVKALYPSMDWGEIVSAVREMILESSMEIQNVHWMEVGKYLAVKMSREEIEAEGLTHVIPRRRGLRLRKITINYLQNKKNAGKWHPARKPGRRQQKTLLALAVSYGVQAVLSNHTYMVGDVLYHQTAGGPIGLELTTSVSRPFMMKWDRLYLDRLKKVGLDMMFYERYVDDSNQAVAIPPPGATYNHETREIGIDRTLVSEDEDEEARLARVLKDVADDIMPGIKMEADHPNKNDDKKMAILDMKVWQDIQLGCILFQHFEKPMATKSIMHAASAQSASCKKSVHTQEVLRRLLNSSTNLDWATETAPIISTYMSRMMTAGYPEKYRKHTLERSLRIYDKMIKDDLEGIRPIYRPKDWNIGERRKSKRKKQHSWATMGGHVAPIFVPPTPNSELANSLKEIAEKEAEKGVWFKIVEMGGRSVQSVLERSNPTATIGCTAADCLPCRSGKGDGGNCHASGITYEVECQLCPPDRKSKYLGESSRNLYTRSKEHEQNFRTGGTKSFMKKHQKEHPAVQVRYTAKVTGRTKDCLTRQIKEAVQIRRSNVNILNSKTEWHQPALFQVQQELYRG